MIKSDGYYKLTISKEEEGALDFIDFVFHMGRRLHEGTILEEDYHRAHNDIRKMLDIDNVIFVPKMKEEEKQVAFLVVVFPLVADNTLHEVLYTEEGYYLIEKDNVDNVQ